MATASRPFSRHRGRMLCLLTSSAGTKPMMSPPMETPDRSTLSIPAWIASASFNWACVTYPSSRRIWPNCLCLTFCSARATPRFGLVQVCLLAKQFTELLSSNRTTVRVCPHPVTSIQDVASLQPQAWQQFTFNAPQPPAKSLSRLARAALSREQGPTPGRRNSDSRVHRIATHATRCGGIKPNHKPSPVTTIRRFEAPALLHKNGFLTYPAAIRGGTLCTRPPRVQQLEAMTASSHRDIRTILRWSRKKII